MIAFKSFVESPRIKPGREFVKVIYDTLRQASQLSLPAVVQESVLRPVIGPFLFYRGDARNL